MERKISKTLLPLRIMSWICGIGIVEYPLGTQRRVASFLFSSIIVATYCTASILAYDCIVIGILIPEVVITKKIIYYFNILLVITTIVLGWFQNEGMQNYSLKIEFADNLMKSIGVPKYQKKMMKSEVIKMAKSCTIILITIALTMENIFAIHLSSLKSVAVLWTTTFPIINLFIVDFMYLSSIRKVFCIALMILLVCYRLNALNQLLCNMSTSSLDSPLHRTITKRMSESDSKISTVCRVSMKPIFVMKIAKFIHLELIKACHDTEKTHGVQILLSIVTTLAVATASAYQSFFIIKRIQLPPAVVVKFIIAYSVWAMYYAINITQFSLVCSECIETSIKTGDIINELYDEPFINEATQAEIRDFNVRLIQTPLKFTACGFINLDYNLIRVMISSITTYLMILIQLGNSSQHSHSSYMKANDTNSTL